MYWLTKVKRMYLPSGIAWYSLISKEIRKSSLALSLLQLCLLDVDVYFILRAPMAARWLEALADSYPIGNPEALPRSLISSWGILHPSLPNLFVQNIVLCLSSPDSLAPLWDPREEFRHPHPKGTERMCSWGRCRFSTGKSEGSY